MHGYENVLFLGPFFSKYLCILLDSYKLICCISDRNDENTVSPISTVEAQKLGKLFSFLVRFRSRFAYSPTIF